MCHWINQGMAKVNFWTFNCYQLSTGKCCNHDCNIKNFLHLSCKSTNKLKQFINVENVANVPNCICELNSCNFLSKHANNIYFLVLAV